MAVWLAHDRIWQIVLEYLLLKTPLSYILFTEPYKALILHIALRWHHGFPEIEPLILSHADGKEWKYDFAQLLEGLHGGYATLTTRKGWIERADAISTVFDEWKREVCEGHEPTVKNWTNGWWFYVQESGTWRKSTIVENSRPERFLPMYGRIEVSNLPHIYLSPPFLPFSLLPFSSFFLVPLPLDYQLIPDWFGLSRNCVTPKVDPSYTSAFGSSFPRSFRERRIGFWRGNLRNTLIFWRLRRVFSLTGSEDGALRSYGMDGKLATFHGDTSAYDLHCGDLDDLWSFS